MSNATCRDLFLRTFFHLNPHKRYLLYSQIPFQTQQTNSHQCSLPVEDIRVGFGNMLKY